MPYFCYVGNHQYVNDPEVEGCQHESCLPFKEVDIPPLGVLLGTVPGGHNIIYQGVGCGQYGMGG